MNNELFSLENKTAIVTGATGLIGKEHCKALYEAGANVAVVDLNLDACKNFAAELGERAEGFAADITDKDSVIKLRDEVTGRFGGINVLVNNAAINDMFESPKAASEQSKFENYPLELWQKSVDVNLTGVFITSQVIGAYLAENGGGSIINVASTYGITAPDQSLYIQADGTQKFYKPPAYSATKGGVIMFTRYLAAYWGHKKVRVNTLSPGGVENNQDEFFIQKYSSRTMLGKMADREDYKGAVVYLASDASGYMTGANLVVDGGWTAW